MVSTDGEILCSGFPKFRNYGEDEEDDRLTRQLIAEGRVLFAEKMDGSLVIRSVINGEVCLRTRGSHQLGEGDEFSFQEVRVLVEERYPRLLDPTLAADITLLFEFTSPANKIILEYEDSALTILGAMVYDHPSGLPVYQGNKDLIDNLAGLFEVEPVTFHDLPYDLDEVAKIVRSWSGSEGIVVWGQLEDGRTHLAKIKAEEYIRMHSLKYHLSGDKIRRLCWWKGIETEEQLRDEMYSLGVDWEFCAFILPDFQEYISRKEYMRQHIEEVKAKVISEGIYNLNSTKSQVVLLKRIFDKQDFNIGIQFCRGNLEYLDRVVDAYALEIPLNGLRSLQEQLREYYEQRGF